MIPILYESNETVFSSNGLGRLRDCISCVVTEERNGIYECDFEYPVNGQNYGKIKLGRIIGVEHDETSDIQPFDIVSCERTIDGTVTFHARHISYRQTGLVARAKSVTSPQNAFSAMKNSTPSNPFSYETDIVSTAFMAAFDGVPRSVRQLLGGIEGSMLDTYGGEYEWDKFKVILHKARGVERNLTIRYGLNMVDYNEEIDYSESYTSVIPYWYSEDKGLVIGSQITLGETSFDGRDTCYPLDVSEKFEDKPTKAQVESMARTMIRNSSLPKQTISVDFIRLQDTEEYAQYASLQSCRLCDTVRVVFPQYDMEGRFKIVKTEYDVLSERFNSMELGDLSTTLSEALGLSDWASPIDTNEVADLSASDFTITAGAFVSGHYKIQGSVVTLNILVKNTASVGSGANVFAGTLNKSNLHPAMMATSAGYYQQHAFGANMATNGAITIRNASSSAITPTNGANITFTYMV